MTKYDVITIGSASEDVFVRSNEFELIQATDLKGREICMPFGEKIDIDEMEFGFGGGAFNTGIGLKKMGLRVGIAINLGKDLTAEKIIKRMKEEGISTELVMYCPKKNSGYSVIIRRSKGDRTILTFRGSNNCFDEKKIKWNELAKAEWIYVSSFDSGKDLLLKIGELAERNGIRIAFNPGAMQRHKGMKNLSGFLKKVEVLIMNKLEATELTGEDSLEKAMKKLYRKGPGIVAITQGKKEIVVYDGKYFYEKMPFDTVKLDSTGAGDAFSSGFLSGFIKYGEIEKAIGYGAINSANVIQFIGTTRGLLSEKKAVELIRKKKWKKRIIRKRRA
ncbi:MAG: carbohydrate kinase family protein [archaeon]|nr:carbohydrate kinase family protein [Candidatus Micrarchaeota archaeon]